MELVFQMVLQLADRVEGIIAHKAMGIYVHPHFPGVGFIGFLSPIDQVKSVEVSLLDAAVCVHNYQW